LTKSSRRLALYPDLNPHVPMQTAKILFPKLFLEKSDLYISTVIEYIQST